MDTGETQISWPVSSIAFNGAMALQPWILVELCYTDDQIGDTDYPSMEPWPFSHGYAENRAVALMKFNILQWSHGPSAMDTGSKCPATKQRHQPFNGAMALQPWIQR